MKPASKFKWSRFFDMKTIASDSWQKDGFLVIEDFASGQECDLLRKKANQLVEEFDPGQIPTVFSTHSHEHASKDYFEQSGDKVRFFLEEGVLDDNGLLRYPKKRSINKIGHAMHDLVPEFKEFSYHPRLLKLTSFLGCDDPLLLQSMLIFKQPGIGGEVDWHQDGSFLLTEPESVIGFWFALEDADLTNGCLWVLPGEHKKRLRKRFRKLDGKLQYLDFDANDSFDLARRTALEVRKGTLVVLHGRLPHYSEANRSTRSRQAYTLHTISASASYLPDNWLQRGPTMPLCYLSTGKS